MGAGGSRPQRSHALAAGQPAWHNRAAFHFKISSVNRGDCVAGIPAAPSIPVRWDLLTPMTEVAGKALAGVLGQHSPVFCWKLPPDHVALILFGAWQLSYLFL